MLPVKTKPEPTWPLPVLAFAQVWVGTVLIAPLREPDASWHHGYAALSTIASLAGLAILALAARNCMRLWRVPPEEASWALVAAAGMVGLFSALWATGPLTIGVWHWDSLVPATFAVYLGVVVVREVKKRLARSKATDEPVDSERLRQ